MKVLIGCETSGIVRDAFLARGHDAWSCDLLPADTNTNRHIQDDVLNVINMDDWDLLMVAHPPCTRLCNSGVRWLSSPPKRLEASYYTDMERAAYAAMNEKERLAFMWDGLRKGVKLFSSLWNADVPLVAIENPVMHKHAKERIDNFQPHAQAIQPWQFAKADETEDNVKKKTCLWLKNLPKLTPTGLLDGSTARDECHKASPGKDRWKERSKFFPGIADAMADQWGGLTLNRMRAA
ncbi:hypothetical protein [Kiloniella sp.]|uniref:hypothetical protein n=1 Tax=Kiloniella sp. TaxID=1938587 RepID=UPI003B0143E5